MLAVSGGGERPGRLPGEPSRGRTFSVPGEPTPSVISPQWNEERRARVLSPRHPHPGREEPCSVCCVGNASTLAVSLRPLPFRPRSATSSTRRGHVLQPPKFQTRARCTQPAGSDSGSKPTAEIPSPEVSEIQLMQRSILVPSVFGENVCARQRVLSST